MNLHVVALYIGIINGILGILGFFINIGRGSGTSSASGKPNIPPEIMRYHLKRQIEMD